VAASLLALGATACSGWPLYSDLPEVDEDAMEAPADPRNLIDLEWEYADEPTESDDPTLITPQALEMDDATVFSGQLNGTGWHDEAVPREFSNAPCSEATGPRTPFDEGDYVADVDYHVLMAADGGQLCAEVLVSDQTIGWDLLLVELDDCGVPVDFAMTGEDLLGYGMGGPGGGWGAVVEAEVHYAVLLAGYYPNDLEHQVDYDLGLSLVSPTSSGGLGLCPLLPGDGGGG
jgi:hypothetical protein